MALHILAPMVVVGILGIALLLHILGRTDPRRLKDEAEALAEWKRAFPASTPQSALLSSDGKAALITTARNIGLVWCFGDDTVARGIKRASLRETAEGLAFDMPDFAAPHVDVTLTPTDRKTWQDRIANT